MKVLLTNDDGIQATGLNAMRRALLGLPDVELAVIAPDSNRSASGRSITTRAPLWVEEVEFGDGTTGHATEGTPVDCVRFAALGLVESPPDLIVSGINHGANAGINVLYSGTVAAAIEGAFFEITSIAVSLEFGEHFDFPYAARHARRVIESILANNPPAGSLFNVNIPSHARGEPKGIKVVPMGVGRHGEGFERRRDPRGRTYYWMTYAPPFRLEGEDNDVISLADGYITVTPLHFDMTRHSRLDQVRGWDWPPPTPPERG